MNLNGYNQGVLLNCHVYVGHLPSFCFWLKRHNLALVPSSSKNMRHLLLLGTSAWAELNPWSGAPSTWPNRGGLILLGNNGSRDNFQNLAFLTTNKRAENGE